MDKNNSGLKKSIKGYEFKNPDLLMQALTHSSFVYENNLPASASNERLEFLGDAILGMVSGSYLYNKFEKLTEGELSKTRAALVCEASLAHSARQINLGDYISLSKGEAYGGGRDKDSILSDALEAVIGAVYLDGGLEPARSFVEDLILQESQDFIADPKSALQEEIQKKSRIPIVYNIIKETGPPHQREFTSQVSHEEIILGKGTGKSKKEAERKAAEEALQRVFPDIKKAVVS